VNSFLAPFERIVDFRTVNRAFDKEHGELTEKGTFRRSTILKNFKSVVDELYLKPYKSFHLGQLEVQIPNWMFLQRGWTQNDLLGVGNQLKHRGSGRKLTIDPRLTEIRIGSLFYQFTEHTLKFDDFIRQPAYCVGNRELEAFLNYSNLRIKPLNKAPEWLPGTWTQLNLDSHQHALIEQQITTALQHGDYSMEALAPVIQLIYAGSIHRSQIAFRLLTRIYQGASETIRNIIRYAFLQLIRSDDKQQSQLAVEQVVALYPANELEKLVTYALGRKILFTLADKRIVWTNLNIRKVTLATDYLKWLANQEAQAKQPSILFQNMTAILYSWSTQFPKYYIQIRSALISSAVNLPSTSILREPLLEAYQAIVNTFSAAMGDPDVEPDERYPGELINWEDVISYDKSVSDAHRQRIFATFSNTSFLNESMYIFFDGKQLTLEDIPPQGIWITLLGSAHGKTVYRVTVQSTERSYKFVINLNDDLDAGQLQTELHWLLACAREHRLDQLVETLGSYQPAYDLWSEEFIPGLTIRQYLKQAVWAGSSDEMPAPEYIWPHFVWTGIFTYTSFWKRTRFKKMISVPSPGKIIVPIHDYYVGGRLVSISDIRPINSPRVFLENLEQALVRNTEDTFPEFNLQIETKIIYYALREALGQKHSTDFFQDILDDPATTPARKQDITAFLTAAKERGFQPKSIYFAARRYHRWLELNHDATLKAKAHFLKDVYRDYNVPASEPEYPDARVQLFTRTVFHDAEPQLKDYLRKLSRNLRHRSLDGRSLKTEISQYINQYDLDDYVAFFLKRLAFPELPPSEDIELIATRSTALDEVEIMISRHDAKGSTYRIRRAMHPKEIIQLQQLFIKANMDVNFTQEHNFLLALNKRERVIGGLFYLTQSENQVFMDKLVISEHQRGHGISRGLLDEFINRMRSARIKIITTGFLHPGYFYKFGFRIEKDQGGLVKYL